jgi:cell division protein FtsZ
MAGAPYRGPSGRTEPCGPGAGPDKARPGAPQVDVRGRTLPLPAQPEDDQLDIPAFLRRQANM